MDLRQQRRAAVRALLTDAAFDLVAEIGYEAATVDLIAAKANVGRTTAFRHFATKDDLLLAWLDDVRVRLADELASRPAAEQPSTAVRASLGALADVYVEHRERTLAVARLAAGVPSLRARYLERKREWEEVIARDVARRRGLEIDDDLEPRLTAQVCLAAASAATEHWLAGGGRGDLPALVDQALRQAAQSLGSAVPGD